MRLGLGPQFRNVALRGAWERGYEAGIHGAGPRQNPYGRRGWSAAFRMAWLSGWNEGCKLLERNLRLEVRA